MKKIYYLSTCDTCKRILKDLKPGPEFEIQDVKINMITEEQVDEIYRLTNSYEAMINKRARKLKDALKEHPVQEDSDYRQLLLMDYTFLKRPVFLIDDEVFLGNSQSTIENVRTALH